MLVDNFRKAYLALCDNHIHVAYDFDAEYAHEMYDEFDNEVRLVIDDFSCFVFD